MDNLFTYVKFRGDISFKKSPFNELDAMVFSYLAGMDFEGIIEEKIRIEEVNKLFKERGLRDDKDERFFEKENLLEECARSIRFRDVYMGNYVKDIDDKEQKTFYAVTFYLSKREAYVCYRGTDGSLLSWRENFNCLYEIPSAGHYSALKYLSEICKPLFMKVGVIGHSKGGNLAVYAAMSLDERLQRKLKEIYVFDAPGFIVDIEEKMGYQNIKDRIKAYVPVSCVIGNLMRPPYKRTIVYGEGAGLYQHDLINWAVTSEGVMKADAVNKYGEDLSNRINDWIDGMEIEDRKPVVEELFSVFSKNGINHLNDLTHMDFKKILTILRCLTSLSSENRELLGIIIKQLSSAH